MVLGDKKVRQQAAKLANQRMRAEILPLLSTQHSRPNSWNPLRADVTGTSDYGMKLGLPDKLALEILANGNLMAKVEEIVIEAIVEAATLWEPQAFVTNILDFLVLGDDSEPLSERQRLLMSAQKHVGTGT